MVFFPFITKLAHGLDSKSGPVYIIQHEEDTYLISLIYVECVLMSTVGERYFMSL